jgi:hypothetical protein
MTNRAMRILTVGLLVVAIEIGWIWGRMMWGLW